MTNTNPTPVTIREPITGALIPAEAFTHEGRDAYRTLADHVGAGIAAGSQFFADTVELVGPALKLGGQYVAGTGPAVSGEHAAYVAYLAAMSSIRAGYGAEPLTLDEYAEAFAAAEAGAASAYDPDGFNVWVSTFGLYNAGELTGFWVPAEFAPGETAEFVAGLYLRGLTIRAENLADVGEEVHCFDIENAPEDGEMSPARAVELAGFIAEIEVGEREAFRAWLANGEDLDAEAADKFRESYAGNYDDLAAWAWEFLDDSGMLAELPAWASQSAVVDAWAADARAGGDVWTSDATSGVFVFHSH